MKYRIRDGGTEAVDPFIDVFERLNDDDRILVEQTSLTKFLKNGNVCNNEFQTMAEKAFKEHDDLIIQIEDKEMRAYNKLFNDAETYEESKMQHMWKIKESVEGSVMGMDEWESKNRSKFLHRETRFGDLYKLLKGPVKDFERGWQKVSMD